MWEQYGDDGVAVCSRYGMLKSVLDGLLDEAYAGLVRYGTDHLAGTFNALEFITTKQVQYSPDRELRVWIAAIDPLAGGNRHIDLDNFPHPVPLDINPRNPWIPECKRRRIDLRSLITGVVISPWAEADAAEEIKLWVRLKRFPDSAKHSELTSGQTPTFKEFRDKKIRQLAGVRISEPDVIEKGSVTTEELDRFFEVLSGLTPDRVRFFVSSTLGNVSLEPRQPSRSDRHSISGDDLART